MAKKSARKKLKKKNLTLLFLFFWVFLVSVAIFVYFRISEKLPPPYNHKFAYTYKGQIYVYDLQTNSTIHIGAGSFNPFYLQWSEDGKFAFLDKNDNLFYLDPKTHNIKKLASGIKNFGWEGSENIGATNFDPDPHTPKSTWKAYSISLIGQIKEVPIDSLQEEANQRLRLVTRIASMDGRYVSQINFVNTSVSLLDINAQRAYKLPDGSFDPYLSADNSYVGFFDNSKNGDHTYHILRMDDVKKGKFTQSLVSGNYPFEDWIDGSKYIYRIRQRNNNPNYKYGYNFAIGIYDMETQTAHPLKEITNVWISAIPLFVAPDRTYLIGETFGPDSAGNQYIIKTSLQTGIDTKMFPFENGAWSPPLIAQ